MLTLTHYTTFSAILFTLGVVGFLTRRNLIVILMSVELMLNAVNVNLVAFSHYLGKPDGQIFAIFIITVAASEAVIGLAILICLFKHKASVDVGDWESLKG